MLHENDGQAAILSTPTTVKLLRYDTSLMRHKWQLHVKPDNSCLHSWRIHVDVKFAADQQADGGSETRVFLQHLRRLLLNDECTAYM